MEARSKIVEDLSEDEREEIAEDSVLNFRDVMVVLKGAFDLVSGHTEEKIFKKKLPSIGKHNFEFVKRERQSIVKPIVKEGYKWDFAHDKRSPVCAVADS